MASLRQYKSSRLQEKQVKEAEEVRERHHRAIAHYWNHAYEHTTVLSCSALDQKAALCYQTLAFESENFKCKRIKVDIKNSHEFYDYSIYPDLLPFALPSENEDYLLPEDLITEVMNIKERVRRVGNAINVPYYKKLKRNYYDNLDSGISRCIMKDEDIPTCSCRTQSGCDDNCQNRICYMECPPNYCPSLLNAKGKTSKRHGDSNENNDSNDSNSNDSDDSDDSDGCDGGSNSNCSVSNGRSPKNYCKNTVIQLKSYPKTEVFATAGRGYGLRLCEDVSANTILIEYLGEVITQAEGVERMSNYGPTDDLYFAGIGGGLMLDAGPMGSTARFANHSCDPSCELQRWNVRGENRLVLVSKGAMIKGSEITYNYQYFEDGLEKLMESVVRQKCLCGVKRCAGTIGGKYVVSESDHWRTKAQNILNNSKRYSLEQLQLHLDRCTSIVSPEYQAIQDIINQGEEWLRKYTFYFVTSMESLPRPVHAAVKGSVVNHGLTEDFVASLLKEVPKNLKLDEALRVEEMVKKGTKLEKVIHTIMESNDGSPKVEWKYLLFLMNELHNVLPISVSGAYYLLKMYQSWSTCTIKWLGNTMSKRSHVDDNVCDESERRKPFDITRLRDTLRFYGLERIISTEGLKYVSLFENRVNTYMERNAIQTGVIDTCMAGTSSNTTESDACHEGLHCLCQTTDELSEVKVFVECNTCIKWFHPQCVNANEGAAKSKHFTCPLCLHKQNMISNFIWKPNTEWTLYDNNNSKKNLSSPPVPPEIKYPLPTPTVMQNTIPEGSLPKSKASVMSPQDLACAITEVQTRVPVSDNPVEFLLTLCSRHTNQWVEKVCLFFSTINISCYLHEPVVMWSRATSESLEAESLVLMKALHLYYELRILRIWPDEAVILRKLIWVITARCIVRNYDDNYNQITVQELGEVVCSGTQVQCSDTSIWLCLNQLHQRCLNLLIRCNEMNGTDDFDGMNGPLAEVDREINLINNYVHLTREYLVAKFKSVVLSNLRSAGERNNEEYCWCRSHASECMIFCERCEDWFHIACVGILSMTKAKKIDKFYCITCTDAAAYPYQWKSDVTL